MIVRNPIDELDGSEAYVLINRGEYHGGSIGPEVEKEPDTKPRRPIGFRMPEPITDPSWLLF